MVNYTLLIVSYNIPNKAIKGGSQCDSPVFGELAGLVETLPDGVLFDRKNPMYYDFLK
jgi:hypothetical protein